MLLSPCDSILGDISHDITLMHAVGNETLAVVDIITSYFFIVVFLYCNFLQLTLVERLLLPYLYIHTCVIFNKCIQTLKNKHAQYFNIGLCDV